MKYFFLLFFLCAAQTTLSQFNSSDFNILGLNITDFNSTNVNGTDTSFNETRLNTTDSNVTSSSYISTTVASVTRKKPDLLRLWRRRRERVPIVLASVRDSNSGVPKCTGVFVSVNTLMTTARCLFCDRDCNLTVYVNDPEEGRVLNYKIKSIKLHEEYEMSPHKNDIGIIELADSVRPSAVMELSDGKVDPTRLRAYSFVGRFRRGDYYFVARRVHVMSNAKCTYTLHNYVPESKVCAYTARRYYLKEQDQGSPLAYLSDGKFYILGRYVTENFEFEIGAKIAVYQAISSHRKWIERYGKNMTDEGKCPAERSTAPPEISIYIGKTNTSDNATLDGYSNSTMGGYSNSTIERNSNSTIGGYSNTTVGGDSNATVGGYSNSTVGIYTNSTTGVSSNPNETVGETAT